MIKPIKHIYISACVAAILCSCSDSDCNYLQNSSDRYIIFGVPQISLNAVTGGFLPTSSRAQLTTSLDKFTVWGFRRPMSLAGVANENGAKQEWNTKSKFFTQGADVFSNMEVKINGEFTSYDNDQPKAWNTTTPESYYTFIATTTTSGTFTMENAVATSGAEHGPRLHFTLASNSTQLSTPLNYLDQPDAMVDGLFDHQKADGRVDLSFSHFMTGIRFKFHNHTTDKELVIKSVTFQGRFYKEAVFDFTTDKMTMSVTDNTYAGTFTLLDNPMSIVAGSADYMRSTDHPVTLLLLPNPNAKLDDTAEGIDEYALGTEKTISIVYSIGGSADRTFENKNFRLNYIPDANTLHTAHFNFVGDEFVVMFQADNDTNWGNGSDNDINIH